MYWRLAIVGYRDFHNYQYLVQLLQAWWQYYGPLLNYPAIALVTGDANGVDALVRLFATNQQLPLLVCVANWVDYGKAAGPLRNQQIIANCDQLLALPAQNSVGTWHTIRLAQQRNIPTDWIMIG